MSPSVRRGFTWAVLVTAGLVVVGVFLQVYFIASYFFGAGEDALDLHENVGGIVHTIEVLVFLAAIVAYWKRWAGLLMPFLLALIGTVQLIFTDADEWVGGLHGLLALVVLFLAHAVAQRSVRDLGLGRHGAAPPA
jgi:hypothetical protein